MWTTLVARKQEFSNVIHFEDLKNIVNQMSENKIIHLILGFLTAAGVNSLCPLELDPPRVFVKYGNSVSVNCSTSEYHEEMGWEARHGGTGLMNDTYVVTWTMENLTDWTIRPICFINMNETQCYETLSVVLFKYPDRVSISSNNSISGLMNEGEKHEINCDIQNVAPVQYLSVTWFKGNEIIETQSFNDTTKTPVNQSSVLTITPDRSDNGTEYRCEATLHLETEDYTIMSSKYPIAVQFGPAISCSDLEILEGQRLGDHCPVVGNPVPSVRWLKDGQLIDPSAHLNKTGTGQYLIEAKGRITIKKSVSVTVLYEPKLACPKMYRGFEHTSHSIRCSVEGYPTPEVSWYKDGEVIDLPDKLTRNDAGEYLIVASNKISNASHTLMIEVQYPPSEILELEDTMDEVGSSVVLKCSSTGYPRPGYSWSYYKAPNVVVSNDDGVSLLYVHNATTENIGSYTCRADNELGEVFKTATLSLKGARAECPIKFSPAMVLMQYGVQGDPVKCESNSLNSNLKEIYWISSGLIINNTEWLPEPQTWNQSSVCNAVFDGIGRCNKSLDFIMYKTLDSESTFYLSPSGPVMEGTEYQLRWDIMEVSPPQNLTVKCYKDSGNKTVVHTNAYASKTGMVSSTLNITFTRKDNGTKITCEALLDIGQTDKTWTTEPLNITVHYMPVINSTNLPRRIPLFRGYPEELVCEAEGHPPPKIEWRYGTDNLIRVRGGNLTVFEAGIYTCTASNDLANSSIEVEVVLKEDYLPLIAGFVAVTVVVTSVIFVFFYSIYYKNTKMGGYNLKNPKTNPQNGNVAQNGRDMPLPMKKLSPGDIYM